MIWDTHMHSNFSGDSEAPGEIMALAAIEKGLAGICFTEHLDLDYPDDPELFLLDLDSYQSYSAELAESYKGQLSILSGIELGLQPQLALRHKELLKSHAFDFVIGSSHVVHGIDPYYSVFYENKTEEQAYLEYFSSILENIYAFDDFDVYGHIDYIVRYGPNKNRYYSYQKYREIIDEILKSLIARDKGIELNTGGFKYGLGHPNPTEDVISRYRELGGEIITLGSDAHKPEHVAWDFQKVPEILKSCGFRYYTVFRKRKAEFFKIP